MKKEVWKKRLEALLKTYRDGGIHTNKIVGDYMLIPARGNMANDVVVFGKMVIGTIEKGVYKEVEFLDDELKKASADFKSVFSRVFKGKAPAKNKTTKKTITVGQTKTDKK